MSKLRNISREGWMVLTAVFTAIAVIAAMVTVPWAKADAAEPTDFVPNNTIGAEGAKIGGDHSWGQLVWAGAPPKGAKNPHTDNDVGWGWCIDYTVADPMLKTGSYKKSTAGAIRFDDPKFQNAAIGIALKLRDATAAGDKKLANRYSVYLAALVSDPSGRAAAIKFIHANDGGNVSGLARPLNGFDGNSEDFTANTGLRILKDNAQTLDEQFEADPSVTIPEQPADAFITVVGPNGEIRHNSRGGQRVVPVDQPGLPDDEGESKTPSISTNADFANGATEVVAGAQVNDTVKYENLVPGKEYTLSAELISKADGKTVLGKGEKTFTPKGAKGEVIVEITVDESVKEPVEAAVAFEELTSVEVDKDGKETPDNTSDNPIAEHKDINDKNQTVPKSGDDESGKPKISTNADFANGATEVVAGAQVNDRVTYENLVPGKEYTLFAELISKEDGKTVLGKGEKTFTPESANGEVVVTITVDESVTEPVEAAVAFEELTSVEVNDKGEDTPDTDPENPNHIAEHKDINDKNQTVTSDSDKPSDTPDKGDGKDNDGDKGSSKKDLPWWLLLIPGLGLIKIITDGGHNGGNGGHDGGNGGHNHGESHDNTGRDDREVTVLDATPPEDAANQPQDFGQPVPSNTHRVEIKHVPSGATELDPGMQDFIK